MAEGRAAANPELGEAISLSKKMQELPNDSKGQSLEGIKPRTPLSKLISHLEFKKREEPKFDLNKLMKENGFKDFWEEVEKKLVGEFGQSCSSCRRTT